MAIDNGSYIGDLRPNLPADEDARSEGAAQIRAVKKALTGTFPNARGEVSASDERMNAVFDNGLIAGEIKMFYSNGGANPLPSGWSWCDGQNGTPDMRNRGVWGWDTIDENDIGTTGGGDDPVVDLSDYINVADHRLSIDEMPEHNHPGSTINFTQGSKGKSDGSQYRVSPNKATVNIASQGGGKPHSHPVSKSQDFDKRAPYIIMGFIMYTGL